MIAAAAVPHRPLGQPLRALAVLLLLAMVWLAARLPGVERRFLAAVAADAKGHGQDGALAATTASQSSAVAVTTPIDAAVHSPSTPPVLPPSPAAPAAIRTASGATPAPPTAPAAPLPAAPQLAALQLAEPPAIVAAPPALATPASPAAPSPGFDLATRAYAALAAGDRRAAERLFGAALATAATPVPPQADAWRQAQNRLNRHWSGDAYTLRRSSGSAGAAASPVLGGGQSGGTLAYALDPLAARPLAVIGRIYAAHAPGGGIAGETAQAAVGVRWQVTPGVSLAAERLVAIGAQTAGDWNLRIAGGGQVRRGRVTADGYGEAGVRGNGDAYAGGQARAMAEIANGRRLVVSAGPGAWGSIQRAQTTVGRLDIGAGVAATAPFGVNISADWRWRVAGNAAPGSGPAVTVSAAF